MTDETWLEWRRRPRISYADADYVRERMHTPATFAKFCEDRVAVHYEGKVAKDVQLVGTEATYFDIRNYEITAGRAFTAQEVQTRAAGARDRLRAGREAAAGRRPARARSVQIGGLPYRIIGVVAKQGTLFGLSLDKFAVMPFSAPGAAAHLPHQHPRRAHRPHRRPGRRWQRAMGEAEAVMRSRRAAQALAGEQFRLPDRGGRAGHLAEDLEDPVPRAARAWWPSRWWSAASSS